jgi:hypothetical protein
VPPRKWGGLFVWSKQTQETEMLNLKTLNQEQTGELIEVARAAPQMGRPFCLEQTNGQRHDRQYIDLG